MAKKTQNNADINVNIKATGAEKFKAATKGLGTGLAVGLITAAAEGKKFKAIWEGIKWGAMTRIGVANLAIISGAAIAATKSLIGLVRGSEALRRGLERTADIELKATQFESLLKGQELAKQKIEELVNFADKTPFEIEGIAEAAKMLEVLGRGDLSSIQSLTMVGDAAAVAGRELNEVAFWVGRFYDGLKSGRPVGEAATRLQEMGLITGDLRARIESVSKAGGDMSTLWGEVQSALERTKGGMEKMSETMRGLESTYADTRASLDQSLAENFLEQEKKSLKDTIEIMKNLKPVFEDTGSVIARISGPIEMAGKGFLRMITGIKGVQVAIGLLTRALIALAVLATPAFIFKLVAALGALNKSKKAVTATTWLLVKATAAETAATKASASGKLFATAANTTLSIALKKTAAAFIWVTAGARAATAGVGQASLAKRTAIVTTRALAVSLYGLGKAFAFLGKIFVGPFLKIIIAVAAIWKLTDAFFKAKKAGDSVRKSTEELNKELNKVSKSVKSLNGLWEYQDKISAAIVTTLGNMGVTASKIRNDSQVGLLLGMNEDLSKLEAYDAQLEVLEMRLKKAMKDNRFSMSDKDRGIEKQDFEVSQEEVVQSLNEKSSTTDNISEKIRIIEQKKAIFDKRAEVGRGLQEGNADVEKAVRDPNMKIKLSEGRVTQAQQMIEGWEQALFSGADEAQNALIEAQKEMVTNVEEKGMSTQEAEFVFQKKMVEIIEKSLTFEGGSVAVAGVAKNKIKEVAAGLDEAADVINQSKNEIKTIKRTGPAQAKMEQAKEDLVEFGTEDSAGDLFVDRSKVSSEVFNNLKSQFAEFGAKIDSSGITVSLEQLRDMEIQMDRNSELAGNWADNTRESAAIQRELNDLLRQQKELVEAVNMEIEEAQGKKARIIFEAEVGEITAANEEFKPDESKVTQTKKALEEVTTLKKAKEARLEVAEIEVIPGLTLGSEEDINKLKEEIAEISETENIISIAIELADDGFEEEAKAKLAELDNTKIKIQAEIEKSSNISEIEEKQKRIKTIEKAEQGIETSETSDERFERLQKEEDERTRKELTISAEKRNMDPAMVQKWVDAQMDLTKKAREIAALTAKKDFDTQLASDEKRLRIQQLILQGKFDEASKEREALEAAERKLKIEERINQLIKEGVKPSEAKDRAEKEAEQEDEQKEITKTEFRKERELSIEEQKALARGDKKTARSIRDFEDFETLKTQGVNAGLNSEEASKLARQEMEAKMAAEARGSVEVTGSYLRSVGGGGRAVGNDPAKVAAERLKNLDKTTEKIYSWLEKNQGKEPWSDPDDTFTI